MGLENCNSSPGGNVAVASEGRSHEFKVCTLVLRGLCFVFLLVALLLIVTDKQTRTLSVNLPGVPTIHIQRSATFSEIKGVQYYVGAMAVVLIYLVFQLLVSVISILTSGSIVGSTKRAWVTYLLDQMIAYLLVSAVTTVAEIGYIAKHGEKKVAWNQVCTDFSRFCNIYGFSMANAFIAAAAFVPIVAISAFHLFRAYGIAAAKGSSSSSAAAP